MVDPLVAELLVSVRELLGALERVELLAAPDRIDAFRAALDKVTTNVALIDQRAAPTFWREGDDVPHVPETETDAAHFALSWNACEIAGKCDAWGSAESVRVYQEWCAAGFPLPATAFIIKASNFIPF